MTDREFQSMWRKIEDFATGYEVTPLLPQGSWGGVDIKFSFSDVANPDEWNPPGGHSTYGIKPYLFHNHGTTLCVVFARGEQSALDEAVNEGRLDHLQIAPDNMGDYFQTGEDEWEGVARLGNASEPFDISTLGMIELPNPEPGSWRIQLQAVYANDEDVPPPYALADMLKEHGAKIGEVTDTSVLVLA